MTGSTDRAARLRRSLKRLCYDIKEAERRGRFHIVRDGATVTEGGDLFGLGLASIEKWIRERAKKR